jgi:diacylglycerol kinase family enzyme
MSRKWIAIVNPRSGRNRNPAHLQQTLAELEPVAHRTVFTSHAGHAAEIASETQSYEGVVAVGGDGTLFEILQGIDRRQQRIALVPSGRGNSLARDLGLLQARSISRIAHWDQAHSIDLMEVRVTAQNGSETTCFSASTVALGYPATVAVHARHLSRLGKMSYAVASAILVPQPFAARVQYGTASPADVSLTGFVANNTRHVANFLVFPNASFCDGYFEVMEMRSGYLKQTLHNISAFSRTCFYEPCYVTRVLSAQLTLHSPQTLLIDGEILSNVIALNIRILPRALACNGPKAQ